MDVSIAKFFALFLLCIYVRSAPTRHEFCTGVRNSALLFNEIAKKTAKGDLEGIKNFTTPLAWMEAQDQCDPGTLRDTPAPCIKKILDVLTSYMSFVKYVAEFESCSVARAVQPVLQQLHKDMRRCVEVKTGMEYHHKVDHSSDESLASWEKPLLCQYTMERLFSFSILTARVFSVGDPANHKEPTEPADCALKN